MFGTFKKYLTPPLVLPFIFGFGLIASGLTLLVIDAGKKVAPQITQSSELAQPTTQFFPTSSPQPSPTPTQPVRLLFGGDLMFDRDIRLAINKNGANFILEPLKPLFTSYDLVVTNLEGPVTTNPSRSVGSVPGSTDNFIFTFDPIILPMLFDHNMKLVNLGNNHIHNFGRAGVDQTKQLLSEHQLSYFGNTGSEATPSARVTIKQMGPHTIAFVNHNQFTVDGFTTALEDLAYATQATDLVIVMTHWGNEYETEAKGVIVDQAHQLVDLGADLIIGTHPHVVQQHEEYRGKRIYYSLGNLVFDQYFSKETQQGLLVGVTIHPSGELAFEEFPITMLRNGQTKLSQ